MDQDSDKYFGNAVKVRREAVGWSKTEFASKLQEAGLKNFHPTTVTRLEDGSRPTRISEANVIARVLDSSLDVLARPDYSYTRLYEASSAFDIACKQIATLEKIASDLRYWSMAVANEVKKELQYSLPKHVQEASEDSLRQYASIVHPERSQYWREKLGSAEDEEIMNFIFKFGTKFPLKEK